MQEFIERPAPAHSRAPARDPPRSIFHLVVFSPPQVQNCNSTERGPCLSRFEGGSLDLTAKTACPIAVLGHPNNKSDSVDGRAEHRVRWACTRAMQRAHLTLACDAHLLGAQIDSPCSGDGPTRLGNLLSVPMTRWRSVPPSRANTMGMQNHSHSF